MHFYSLILYLKKIYLTNYRKKNNSLFFFSYNNNNNNNKNNNNNNNDNLNNENFIDKKATIKTYLQFISPRKHYLHYVQLKHYLQFLSIKKKKGHLISIVKIHSVKNILYIRKKKFN